MAYQVNLRKNALKALENINEPYYSRIKSAIYNLADNPRPYGYKKLNDRDGFRIKVSDYRIVYDIFDRLLVIDVIAVGHRREVYR